MVRLAVLSLLIPPCIPPQLTTELYVHKKTKKDKQLRKVK